MNPEDGYEEYAPETMPVSAPRAQIGRVKYSHDAMVDAVIANPGVHQNEIAAMFGYSPSWVSIIFCSNEFLIRLAQRREELVDPVILLSIEERFKALTCRSLDVLQEKLSAPSSQISDSLALRAAELGAKALGIGGNAAPAGSNEKSSERLERLADRLTGLIQNRRGEIQDVQAIEISREQAPSAGESAS